MTYNNIIELFERFADNHFFVKKFYQGEIPEITNDKKTEYPLLYPLYTGSTYDVHVENMNFEVYILDLPLTKEDRVDQQRNIVSDCKQVAEDIIADINNGGNIFVFTDQVDVVDSSITPAIDTQTNLMSGVILNLTIALPYTASACDAPLTGVTPTSGACQDATYQNSDGSFSQAIASGNTFTSADITVTDVNGSTRAVASNKNITCTFASIVVKDSGGGTLTTIASYPVGGEVTVSASTVTNYPQSLYHRKPTYSSVTTGDYADLYANGRFDIWKPSVAVQMVQLGADNYTLASNNRFSNTSRYTSTDGTASDTGTARFSSYGSGTSGIVRDNFLGIMWYNVALGSSSTTWNNAQSEIDTINGSSFGGFTDWIVPTRDMITLSACPDNNEEVDASPNLIEATSGQRFITCERLPYVSQGYMVFYTNGGETSQSLTTTASGKNRVVGARIMTLSELFG